MKNKKKILYTTGLILIALTGYHTLWGLLFPLSPIIVGFEQKESDRATIYYRKGIDISKYVMVDSLIEEAENFHRLGFKKKVEIFLFDSDKEFAKRTGINTRFATTPLYGRIFVSGKADKDIREGNIHLDVYLKHELSHSLLQQNMSLYRSQYYPGWLLEGVAVFSSNQMGVDGYFTKEETFSKIRDGYFLNTDDWSTTFLKPQGEKVKNFPLTNKYWFIYSEFGCLVDDLIRTYGKERFLQYMTELLKEADDRKVFQRNFGINHDEYINDFKRRIGYKSSTGNKSKVL